MPRHQRLTLAVLTGTALAFALSQTIVIPALPAIQAQLGSSTEAVTLVLTAFLLSASVATPIVGRLGDMFGRKRMLVATLAIYGTGSLLAALSSSIELLVAGRTIQGAAGGVFPLSYGIVRDEFPRARIPGAIGLIGATFGIGSGLGVVLSGIIVDHLDYEWIFWLALVPVSVALVATILFVPESPVRNLARIDWAGAAMLSAGLVALLLGISEGDAWGWGSTRIVGLLAVAALTLSGWIWFELRRDDPLVDMAMMRNPAVLRTNVTTLLVGFGMITAFALIPKFVQSPVGGGFGFGASVTEAGLFLLPASIGMLVTGPISGWLGGRFGSRLPLLIGTAAATVSFGFLALAHDARWCIYLGAAGLGIGIGFSYAAMPNLIVQEVAQSRTSVATAVNSVMRTIGGAIGGQVAATILTGHSLSAVGSERGYTTAFAVAAVAVAIAFLLGAGLPREARSASAAVP